MAYMLDGEAFNYRFKITAQNAKVISTETDFPFFYDLANAPAGFAAHSKADGGDVRAALGDGTTRVPLDMRYINNGTGDGDLAYLADTNSTGDEDYYIYYGNPALSQPAVGAANGRYAVYVGFVAVYTFSTDPFTANVFDHTSNSNDGVSSGWGSSDFIDMKMGKGVQCSANKYFSVSDSAELNPADISISCLFHTGTAGFLSTNYLLSKGTAGAPIRVNYELVTTGGVVKLQFYDGSWHTPAGTQNVNTLGRYVYAGATFNDTTKDAKIYTGFDTTAFEEVITNLAGLSLPNGANPLQLCKSGFVAPTSEFRFTETRISDSIRSAGWMETERENMQNNDTFFVTGAEEEDLTPAPFTSASPFIWFD